MKNLYWRTVVEAYQSALNHNVFRHSAAMSFYAVISLAPLLALFQAAFGTRVDPEMMEKSLIEDISHYVSPAAAEATRTMIEHMGSPAPDQVSIVFGFAALLFGA